MAKSKAQQLQEALEAGDLEKAKILAAEIAKKPSRKPTKASAKPKATKPRTRTPKPVESEPEPLQTPPAPTRIYDDSQWMAPSQASMDRGTRIGGDGSVRVQCRHESMQGRGKLVQFETAPALKLTKAQEKAEKAMSQQAAMARRPPAVKMSINCEGCGRHFSVYASETSVAADDDYRSYRFYKCDRCIKRGR